MAGAKDYRIYDTATPNDVKYAAMAYMIPGQSCPGYACGNHFVTQPDGVTPVFPYQIASGSSGGRHHRQGDHRSEGAALDQEVHFENY